MVDYLKEHSGQSSLAVARRIGMVEYTMRNIKAGKSQAGIEDVKVLLSHFPELSDLVAQHGLTVQKEPHFKSAHYTKPSVEEPPPIYHRMPDSIASTLQRIESALQDILRY